jgi:hypothetical protein
LDHLERIHYMDDRIKDMDIERLNRENDLLKVIIAEVLKRPDLLVPDRGVAGAHFVLSRPGA